MEKRILTMNKLKIPNSIFKIQDSKEFSIFNLQSLIRSSGFSFIELMTVVAIMAILIIASMPAFRNYARSKNLKEGTNMIVSALRKTRDAAITYRKRYRTVFDTVNDAVSIYIDGDDVNPVEKWVKLPEFVIFSSPTVTVRNFPKGSASADLRYAEFKISGAANEGGSIILLDESTQDTKKISFNNITGRIRVEE